MGRRKKLINNSGIPQHEIEHIARCILPDILAYYESEEGQREFREWQAQREAEQAEGKEGKRSIRRKRRMVKVHRTVFTAAALPPPFRVLPFLLGVAVRQKGLVTLRCCRRRAGGKQQSTGLLHFNFRVPPGESKTVYPQRDTPFLVRQKGLEPPTLGTGIRCSIH